MLLNCCVVQVSESPLDCKEIQPVHPKGNQSWIFIGKTDAEAETPILWPPDAKNWVLGKDADAGNDWRQEDKGTTEDEMVGWHHCLSEHEFLASSGNCWWTGKSDMLQSKGSQRVRHNWETWIDLLTATLSYLFNLFSTTLGLCCCIWAFSSCWEWGLLSSCGALASHCLGFSCLRGQALGSMDFSSYSTQAQ